MPSVAPEILRVPGERLLRLAAEALGALLPEGAERCAWLFAGPPPEAGAGEGSSSRPSAGARSSAGGLPAGQGEEAEGPVMAAGAAVDHPGALADGGAGGAGTVADWRGLTPADQRLALWLRRHPSLGARERRWLSDRIYDVLRHGRAYELFLQRVSVEPEGNGRFPAEPPSTSQASGSSRIGACGEGNEPSLPERLRRLVLLSEACRLQDALLTVDDSAPARSGVGVCEEEAGAVTEGADVAGRAEGLGSVPVTAMPTTTTMAAGLVGAALSGSPTVETLCRLAEAHRHWLRQQPPAVRYSLPDWIWAGFRQTHGEAEAQRLAAVLLRPASIEIRVNLLKGKPAVLQRKLAEEGIMAERVPDAPNALRLAGRPALARSPRFAEGWFELQDAGSQRIVETCAARRGERVIDFCAGAGGKTLALAARMRDQGQILAFDTEASRLDRLGPRLARAGVSIVTSLRLDGSEDARLARYQRWADLVLVDAPCSGSGTFRRHPDLKWRLRPEDVSRYQAVQREILQAAVRLLRPGGRLVYATCSLLGQENQQQTAWFAQWLAGQGAKAAPLAEVSSQHWLPDEAGGDAFFMSEWRSPR